MLTSEQKLVDIAIRNEFLAILDIITKRYTQTKEAGLVPYIKDFYQTVADLNHKIDTHRYPVLRTSISRVKE